MEARREKLYLAEIAQQVAGAERAYRRTFEALSSPDRGQAFDELADFLGHFGNVSKFLFPSGKKPSDRMLARTAYLRGVLGVAEDSELKERKLRDSLEHFDERLDDFYDRNELGNIMDGCIGPFAQGAVVGWMVRNFDPDAEIYVFMGKRHDLRQMRNLLSELLDVVRERHKEIARSEFWDTIKKMRAERGPDAIKLSQAKLEEMAEEAAALQVTY